MGVVEELDAHRSIMVDTAPIIYLIEEHPRFGKIVDQIFLVLA